MVDISTEEDMDARNTHESATSSALCATKNGAVVFVTTKLIPIIRYPGRKLLQCNARCVEKNKMSPRCVFVVELLWRITIVISVICSTVLPLNCTSIIVQIAESAGKRLSENHWFIVMRVKRVFILTRPIRVLSTP